MPRSLSSARTGRRGPRRWRRLPARCLTNLRLGRRQTLTVCHSGAHEPRELSDMWFRVEFELNVLKAAFICGQLCLARVCLGTLQAQLAGNKAACRVSEQLEVGESADPRASSCAMWGLRRWRRVHQHYGTTLRQLAGLPCRPPALFSAGW